MRRYLDIFRRHKIVLLLPIVIAVLASGWYAQSKPKTYQTTMDVFFDTAAPNPSSLQDAPANGQGPAVQGETQLTEFISTAQFLVDVGRRGPLAAQIEKSGVSGKAAVDSAIESKLQNAFSVTTTGPQVVRITMSGHDPSYMTGTLSALSAEYVDEVTTTLKKRDTTSLTYYQGQARQATAVLQQATSAQDAYQRAHPKATTFSDATLSQLSEVASQAQTTLTTLQGSVQTAQLALQNVQTAAAFRVVDPPSNPVAKSLKKKDLGIVVAGLLAGIVISALLLSALSSLDQTARSEEDIAEFLEVDLVASISNLPRRPEIGMGKATTP